MLIVNCPFCKEKIKLKDKLAYYPVELESCPNCGELFAVEYGTKTVFTARSRKLKEANNG